MFKRSAFRNVAYYMIVLGFLIYGGLRLYGTVPAVGQIMGWMNTDIGRLVVEALKPGFPELSAGAIIPLSIEVYMGWSALMGITLTLGSFLALFKLRAGYALMGLYFVLFGAGFVNYLAFNIKLLHFAAGLMLFLLMLWLSNRPWRSQRPRENNLIHA